MDSDGDGLISPDHFELSTIPTDMLEHLEAILFEIHQSKSPTNFPSFLKIVEKYDLYEDLQKVRFRNRRGLKLIVFEVFVFRGAKRGEEN